MSDGAVLLFLIGLFAACLLIEWWARLRQQAREEQAELDRIAAETSARVMCDPDPPRQPAPVPPPVEAPSPNLPPNVVDLAAARASRRAG